MKKKNIFAIAIVILILLSNYINLPIYAEEVALDSDFFEQEEQVNDVDLEAIELIEENNSTRTEQIETTKIDNEIDEESNKELFPSDLKINFEEDFYENTSEIVYQYIKGQTNIRNSPIE